ncbi:hypothetical protein SCHPADRAFT_208885 [Schizopora paradoxa]|uniref:F-box domain-containing protein n=1 Tax=Schizopora paradoxa TaxID=27342 RepID=A0A0H2RWT5_9AGAM|nr:hypothetical protein SCHPADRAFT_208885 [Schizopora paradoxa]
MSKSTAQPVALMMPDIVTRIIEFAIAKRGEEWRVIDLTSVWEDDGMLSVPASFTTNTQLSFLTVCKAWYEIIMSTPLLWATCSAILHWPQCSDVVGTSSMLNTYFRRSKVVPFTLFFFASMEEETFGDDGDPIYALNDMLHRIFTQQGHRFEAIYLTIIVTDTTNHDFEFEFNFPRHPTPTPTPLEVSLKDLTRLKSLNLDLDVPNSSVELVPHRRLEFLHLSAGTSVSVQGFDHTAVAQFPNLRNLRMCIQNTKTILDDWKILQASPNIEFLHFRCVPRHSFIPIPGSESQDLSTMPPLSLPRLRHLDIIANSKTTLDVLSRASTPSLTSLIISSFELSNYSVKELTTLLGRLPLKSFKVSIKTTEDTLCKATVGALFHALLVLRNLELDLGSRNENQVMQLLELLRDTLHPDEKKEAHTLPNLRVLSVDIGFYDKADKAEAHDVLRNIVSICRQKYLSGFLLKLIARSSLIVREPAQVELMPLLLNDAHIRRCVSDTFIVSINGVPVEGFSA